MTFWILCALALFFVQTLMPAGFRYAANPMDAAGPRDAPPEISTQGARAERALANMKEAMIFFIPLSLLGLSVEGAVLGAQIFVIARLVYVPIYILGVPYARTFVWCFSVLGLILMAVAVAV